MPCVTPTAKILLTGVNGYIGAHVAKDLLDRGYTVIGTVRSSAKGDEITKYLGEYGSRFSYVVVRDIAQPGAFDKVMSVGKFDGVAHTAAPVPSGASILSGASTLKDDFNAATEGTLNILRSIKDHGHTVKRVVFTSSAMAASQLEAGVKHTEAHWNEKSLKIVEEKGDMASDLERYMASKVLSERAAWKFVQDNEEKVNFDLVTVLPVAVIGAPINGNTTLDQLVAANLLFEGLKVPRTESQLEESPLGIVDVKDVAALHSQAFIQPGAAGHRVMASGAEPSWQDIYDALNEEPPFPGVPYGKPGVGRRPNDESLEWDMTYSQSLLGRKMTGAKEMIREAARYHQGAGWEFVRA
ncbi:unnamed protein product [Rhizoctonia solani]|uniref:NAD-dependent epimerase/dehydratase domain-containing protein n=1 Tax=Rhizoctonia solani TaxID=456999 RepID=A0A8H3DQB3_9AGAM|nr:unnamed protein product [Rhizoctonia solani]